MASPTFTVTIVDKIENELILDVSACNNPNQTVPEKNYFVWHALLDAFGQHYRAGTIRKKLNEGIMIWKEDHSAHPYSLLYRLHIHALDEWLGNFGDMDDLSIPEGYTYEFLHYFSNDPAYAEQCQQIKTFPAISELIQKIEVLKEDTYQLNPDSNEELTKKILKVTVADKDFIAHCEKDAWFEVYWW